ncbi:MAG: T9SS type A sorting domain-containing protein, partial [Bacteroidetes bacterium]|nr:T9SS type A sorting domain-containing protein [Bacteroidota bacterium]
LLYLHYKITGSKSLVNLYETNAKAALDFVVNHNLDTDGYSWSSWQKWISDGQWHLWKYKYTADQGDVWLGLKAGALLYDTDKYGPYANFIEMNAPKDFYCTSKGRFCKGIDDFGVKDWALDGFDGIFPNGYLPWMWCSGVETEGAYNWLKSYVQTDGSIKIDSGPKYALSVSVYGMASANLKHTQPTSSFQWLNRTPSAGPFDNISGGVHDLPTSGSSLYSNVTGFSLISLMGWVPGFSCSINSLPNDAVEEQKKHLLYPNPFSTETTLQTNVNLKDATLTVYNSVVQQVKQIKNISGQAITFHRDNLPSGLYIVRLTEENNIIAEDKLVITDK